MSTEIASIEKQEQGLTASKVEGFQAIEQFTQLVNQKPEQKSIHKTPDGKAEDMPISFVETKLDEIYMRQWGTENMSFSMVGNEICCDLTLWVIDPITHLKITRGGTAALPVMMDAVPPRLKFIPGPEEAEEKQRERNMWSLDMQNKKPHALKLQRAAVKQIAIKNAAKSLGKIFGRDLNRKHEDSPEEFYDELINNKELLNEAKALIQKASTDEDFNFIKETYTELMSNVEFQKELVYYTRKFDKWKAEKAKQS